MRPALLDTSVYIAALRQGEQAILALRRLASGSPVWLSAVVLEELYAGAGAAGRRAVERLERDFGQASRMVVPNLSDWVQTGLVLNQLAARYGYEQIGRGRLTNDALIAMSARRQGITVLTANERDFARLAEFRSFHWDVLTLSGNSM